MIVSLALSSNSSCVKVGSVGFYKGSSAKSLMIPTNFVTGSIIIVSTSSVMMTEPTLIIKHVKIVIPNSLKALLYDVDFTLNLA